MHRPQSGVFRGLFFRELTTDHTDHTENGPLPSALLPCSTLSALRPLPSCPLPCSTLSALRPLPSCPLPCSTLSALRSKLSSVLRPPPSDLRPPVPCPSYP